MAIYTRKGDKGETELPRSGKVSKTDPIIEALGSIDELNASLGVVLARLEQNCRADLEKILRDIQNNLFAVGADVAVSGDLCVSERKNPPARKNVTAAQRTFSSAVKKLEKAIDEISAKVAMPKGFILPGGSETAAQLHLARTICRRAERRLTAINHSNNKVKVYLKYLNRLSDFLFAAALLANFKSKTKELRWKKR